MTSQENTGKADIVRISSRWKVRIVKGYRKSQKRNTKVWYKGKDDSIFTYPAFRIIGMFYWIK